MKMVLPDDPAPRFAYGLGLIADPLPSGTVWGHSGGGFGYHHRPFLDLASGRFVVCMRNGTAGFRTDPTTAALPDFTPQLRAEAYTALLG